MHDPIEEEVCKELLGLVRAWIAERAEDRTIDLLGPLAGARGASPSGAAVAKAGELNADRAAERAQTSPAEVADEDVGGELTAQLRCFADALPFQVWSAHPSGEISFSNRHLLDYFDCSPEQLLGAGWLSTLHEDDVPRAVETWTRCLETGEPYNIEFRLRRASDQTYREHVVRALPQRDRSGKIVSWIGAAMDVADERRTEVALRERLQIIERQQEAIWTLSTPIIEVWDRVLTMQVLGAVDGSRAQRMMEVLLDAVVRIGCRHAIIDLTGVSFLDTDTADHIIKLVNALRLLGAQGIVVGIQPEVAQTVVSLGVDLSNIKTLSNLREALLFAMQSSGTAPWQTQGPVEAPRP